METGKESDIPEAFDMVMIDHEKVVRRRHAKESKKSIVKVTVKVKVNLKGTVKRCNIIVDYKVE